MRLKDLAAAATGAVQLTNLPFEFGQAVVEAFEERVRCGLHAGAVTGPRRKLATMRLAPC